jgi:hypothetical protein
MEKDKVSIRYGTHTLQCIFLLYMAGCWVGCGGPDKVFRTRYSYLCICAAVSHSTEGISGNFLAVLRGVASYTLAYVFVYI